MRWLCFCASSAWMPECCYQASRLSNHDSTGAAEPCLASGNHLHRAACIADGQGVAIDGVGGRFLQRGQILRLLLHHAFGRFAGHTRAGERTDLEGRILALIRAKVPIAPAAARSLHRPRRNPAKCRCRQSASQRPVSRCYSSPLSIPSRPARPVRWPQSRPLALRRWHREWSACLPSML